MQKEELLHLHMLMYHIRLYLQDISLDEVRTERYNSLEISPFHIHKGKNSHSDALLILGNEIIYHIHEKILPPPVCSPTDEPLRVVAGL